MKFYSTWIDLHNIFVIFYITILYTYERIKVYVVVYVGYILLYKQGKMCIVFLILYEPKLEA